MTAQVLTLLLLVPSASIFIYAGVHEYLRYKSEGPATYGLVYDEETGTTHVTGIDAGQERYDPDDYDPNAHNDRDSRPDSETGTA